MNKELIDEYSRMFNDGKFIELERAARFYLLKYENSGVAYKLLAACLQVQGKDAQHEAKRAADLLPDDSEAHFNYGVILQKNDKSKESIPVYQKAIAIKPDYAAAYNNLGNAFKDTNRPHAAVQCYWRCLQIDPTMVEAYLNMGNDLGAIGHYPQAISSYRHGLMLKPDFHELYTSLIFTTDLMSGPDTESAQKVRREWHDACVSKIGRYARHDNVPDPDRKIRLGYVSADLREHSAARSFGSMLVDYDRERFEVYAYCNNAKDKPDAYTDLFRENATVWRLINKIEDEELAEIIYQDKIDILIDLSGHTGGNRMFVFARKPAPVQITAWGYASGTGMDAMDVLFSDPVVIPEAERKHYTEEIRYLPSLLGTFFRDAFPDPGPLPALKSGGITFGSLNRMAKLTDDTLNTWAQILLRVPNSRIYLKSGGFDDANTKSRILWHFGRVGIRHERVVMHGSSDWTTHLEANQYIDIGLDPFPHGGGMTSLESFVMGVPVVTLRYPTIAGRLGASFNKSLGLNDWTAETKEQYVEIAVAKIKDLKALSDLRSRLPDLFRQSPLGNEEAYVKAVEAQYIDLWRRWCHKINLTSEKTVA